MGIKSPRTRQKWSCSEGCWAFMIYWTARSDGLRPEALRFHWNSDFSLMKERCKTKVRDRESHWVICDSEDPDSNSEPKRKKQRAENNSLLNERTVVPAHFLQLGGKEDKFPLLSKAFSSRCAPNRYLVILYLLPLCLCTSRGGESPVCPDTEAVQSLPDTSHRLPPWLCAALTPTWFVGLVSTPSPA